MTTVDFDQWAVPPLTVTLNGRTFTIAPPTVPQQRTVNAYATLLLADSGADVHPTDEHRQLAAAPLDIGVLGADLVAEMAAAGVAAETVDRVAVYAALYWTRGKSTADLLASAMWAGRTTTTPAARKPRAKTGRAV